MTDVDKRLEAIETKIDGISNTLSQIAIQRDRIERLEERMHAIWTRYDTLISPDGILHKLDNFQASCPRNTVRWVWAILVPMGLTLLGMAVAMMRCIP